MTKTPLPHGKKLSKNHLYPCGRGRPEGAEEGYLIRIYLHSLAFFIHLVGCSPLRRIIFAPHPLLRSDLSHTGERCSFIGFLWGGARQKSPFPLWERCSFI